MPLTRGRQAHTSALGEASRTSPTNSSSTSSKKTTPRVTPSRTHHAGEVRAGALHGGEHVFDLVLEGGRWPGGGGVWPGPAGHSHPRRHTRHPSGADSRKSPPQYRRSGSAKTRAWRRGVRSAPGGLLGHGHQGMDRHADIPRRLVTEFQRRTQEVELVLLDQPSVRFLDDVVHLLRREGAGHLILRLDAHSSHDGLGDRLHDVNERTQQPGQPIERRHEHQRRPLRRRSRGSWGSSRRRRRADRRR